ncbi:MAG: glutamate synthase-related protein [Candidatus Bilamarchaeum sp.]
MTKVMRDYLPVARLTESRDTGGRKYFTPPIVEAIRHLATTGLSDFELGKLTEFRPRYASAPHPHSDMLLVRPNSGSGATLCDMSGSIGGLSLSSLTVIGEMSYGALQPEAHIAFADAAAKNNFLFGVGEGGVVPQIWPNNRIMIQIATGLFGITPELLENCAAITIKMSQSAKPGMGGHLPAFKVTVEIAQLRGLPKGVDALSDSSRVFSIEEMRMLVLALKQATNDKPVLIKVAATHHISAVAAGAARSGADAIIIDGRGGGTGAAPAVHRDNVGMPIELAVALAHRAVLGLGKDKRRNFKILAAGRVDSPEKAFKLELLGADGVMLGTAALNALGCVNVNLCHRDCPTAIAAVPRDTDGTRKKVLDVELSKLRASKYYLGFVATLADIHRAFGFSTPADAIGRTDLLVAHGMSDSLVKLLGIGSSSPSFATPVSDNIYYSDKRLRELAENEHYSVASMGRTTDLDPPYSNLDLISHDGRTVVGPAYDPYREDIETITTFGRRTYSSPIFLVGSSDEHVSLSRRKNVPLFTGNCENGSPNKVLSLNAEDIESKYDSIRSSAGVHIKGSDLTSEVVARLRSIAPDSVIYTDVSASENIREDVVRLANLGVDSIIIAGNMSMKETVPIDIAISQADDALRYAIRDGTIARNKVKLIAKTTVRGARDIFALHCLGADSVLVDLDELVPKIDEKKRSKLYGNLVTELRIVMGAAGLSRMPAIIGNRDILRADHELAEDKRNLLGVGLLGA